MAALGATIWALFSSEPTSQIELVGHCKKFECKEESSSCFLLFSRLIGSRAHLLLEEMVGLLRKGLEYMVLYLFPRSPGAEACPPLLLMLAAALAPDQQIDRLFRW
jgi:hypothetical protein